MQRDI